MRQQTQRVPLRISVNMARNEVVSTTSTGGGMPSLRDASSKPRLEELPGGGRIHGCFAAAHLGELAPKKRKGSHRCKPLICWLPWAQPDQEVHTNQVVPVLSRDSAPPATEQWTTREMHPPEAWPPDRRGRLRGHHAGDVGQGDETRCSAPSSWARTSAWPQVRSVPGQAPTSPPM
jgi:hypothetical protein